MIRFRILLIGGWLGVLSGLGTGPAAADEDAKLTAFFQKYLDAEFKLKPLDATRLGDHRFDHRLEDLTPRARAGWRKQTQKYLQELSTQVNIDSLTRSGKIDHAILLTHLQRSLWLLDNTRPFEEDPRIYNDYISDSVYLLLTQSTLTKGENLKNCVTRMEQIPQVIAAARESLTNPPRVFVETAIRQNRGAIAFYERGIFETAGETPLLSELKPASQKVVQNLMEYQKFLEEKLLPRATGEWRLGSEKFDKKLDLELEADLSSAQVLREARAEFQRVEQEMYTVAKQLWGQVFPKKPLPPDDDTGRQATITQVLQHLNRDHGKAEDLVRDASQVALQIKQFIAEYDILRLPDPDRCQIMEMPEFQRGNTMAFLNPAPPLDPKAASVYAISPPARDWDSRRVNSFLEEYNRHMLHLLTIHEAFPGHYVQLEYSNRHPSLIRRVLSSGVFAEGWAVYTEQMMLDQGYGKGDLALRLNQLKWYLRAVANAILDNQMHCTIMTDEEALKFLTDRAYQTEAEALAKIIRAKQSSCQLSAYFVGRTAFYKLRQTLQRELGDEFDLGRFHEAVLNHGTLPVRYLPELVRERLKQAR
ncbi:MAG TPA: DUF885 domain-containing protein [Gemmataceae bacterium]|nr:DUF885 domain-containing protein [Gemmataceae bacterium]